MQPLKGLSLRPRLALLLAGVLAVCFSLVGLLHYENMHLALLTEIDETLVLRAANVGDQLRDSGVRDREAARQVNLDEVRPFAMGSSPEVYVELVAPEGEVLKTSSNLHGLSLPPTPGGQPKETVSVEGMRLRRLTVPYRVGTEPLLHIVVGESLYLMDASLALAAQRTVAIALLTLALTMFFCGMALDQGLRPLRRLANTIDTIVRTGDMSRRVEVPPGDDEVAKVASTFNVLIGRVSGLLDAQREFLADTSHELRNPLTVIQTDLDLLGRELDAETRREVSEEASRETGRMIRLVQDLMELSWAETEKKIRPESIDLRSLAQRLVERLSSQAEHSTLELEPGPDPLVWADPERVEQILINLISNALRHSGGEVRLAIDLDQTQASITVSDNGCGIAPEHLPKLFERFYRVDKSRNRVSGGAGLGLPLARALARAHGGDITVESTLGQGSAFKLSLPLTPL
ncbi:MAG: HAMP domain-containing histidine kinase [Candidatus Eremiobacteraeota bacterium]|nr:HAMP domain-containing histidine kinase [Candidatus Eremiobacteraeota bacterium]